MRTAAITPPMTILLSLTREHPRAATATVLVVDDEPDILNAIEELLHDAFPQIRVVTAHSGLEGLEVLRRESVQLIVTDYKMPGMNGLEFLKEAREVAPKAPRILVTAFGRDVARQAPNSEAQVDALFNKPIEPGPLLRSVEKLLGAAP